MIQIILLVILVLVSVTGSAQRVDFSNIRFKYIHLPLFPLDQQHESFQSILNIVLPDDTWEVDKLERNEIRTRDLNKAIGIWLARTGKDEASRKKEGTSPEICQMLWCNCAIAYLWNGEFDRAKEALSSAKEMNLENTSRSQARMMEDLENR